MQRFKTSDGELHLKTLIENHFEKTGREKAEQILNNWDNWDEELSRF